MIGRSHLAHGVVTGTWLGYALPLPDGMRVVAALVAVAGSMAPDLDHFNATATRSFHDGRALSWMVRRFGGHRTWTHEPSTGPPIFAAIVGVGAWFLDGDFGRYWWAWALAMLVGCLTHCYGDARTVTGIPCRWAAGGRLRIGRTIRTNSDAEHLRLRLLYTPAAALSVFGAFYLMSI